MGLIKFLFYRKKEQSVLASKKYGEKQSKIEDLNKSVFAKKTISLEDKRIEDDVCNREKCLLAGKYPKIFTEAEEKEKEV